MRSFNRQNSQARPICFELDYTMNADGSVLVCYGNTKVICTAFLEEKVPPFLKNSGKGWVTAEYGMLPGSTHSRAQREAARGKQSGRTQEIQRLIARSLRACVNLNELGERSITVDCDVIQADGGTRTASITGGCLALLLCLWKYRKKFIQSPMHTRVGAISVGIHQGTILVDLDYSEDSSTDVDLNLVSTHQGSLVEIQGTAEGQTFSPAELTEVVRQGAEALNGIFAQQRTVLEDYGVTASWIP